MNTTQQFAYLAGMIDGEGTIALHRHKQHERSHWQYRPRVLVVNTDREVIEFLATTFGGKVTVQTAARGAWKPLYQWRVIAMKDVARILDGCAPFLIVKRDRAAVLRRFVAARLAEPFSPYTDIEDRACAELALLNRPAKPEGLKSCA